MKLLVLDGNSILNRAFYGIRLLSTKEGLYTNGIYGFMTMLEKLKHETEPDAVAIAFDMQLQSPSRPQVQLGGEPPGPIPGGGQHRPL